MNLVPIYTFIIFCSIAIVCESEETAPVPCSTPLGEQGACLPLRACPDLKQTYCSGNESDQTYIEALACGEKSFHVCCITQNVPTPPPTTTTKQQPKKDVKDSPKGTTNKKPMKPATNSHRNRNLLPNRRYCGMQHADDYIHEGNEASIHEFPWLVEIECQPSTTKFAGVLINERYILSNQVCHGNGKTVVTLGKNKASADASCVITRFNETECTDPEQKFTATEIIMHPNETFSLLRVEKRITFTDYIRPICLPFEKRDKPKTHSKIVSSGWDTPVGAKKKLTYEVVANDQCKEGNIAPINLKYVCAKRSATQQHTTCNADKGSPVMFKYKFNWYMVGVLGDPQCATRKPVLTKAVDEDVLNWILNSVHT